MKKKQILAVHPGGEESFVFPTAGGTVRLSATGDALTPYGGLVPWSAFVRRCGMIEALAESCPVQRRSGNASKVYDVLQSFVLTALCDGRRFVHVNRLREDPAVCELLGMERVVGDDSIRRLFAEVSPEQGAHWVAKAAEPIWRALPELLILDWDSTVQSKYGHQEGAEVGYNPRKPGRRSFHPLMAVAAGTRLCPYYRFRPGNTVTATEWEKAMEECQRWLGERRVWLNRGDLGLGQEKIMAWHERGGQRPRYLFKLKLTANVRRAIAAVAEEKWQGPSQRGVLQVAEAELQLPGWSCARRIVIGRRLLGAVSAEAGGTFWEQCHHEFEVYVTNLEAAQINAWQIVELYRQRADVENVFDELKNQWGFDGFTARRRAVSELATRLLLLVYNLWNLFLRLMSPQRHMEAGNGRRWFLLIAARLVQSGRQRVLQICASGPWWQRLKLAYQRLCQWLQATAPQLASTPAQLADFSPLKPSFAPLNCGN